MKSKVVLVAAGMVLGLLATTAPAHGAGPRPMFQMPFTCGETWHASTYGNHGAIDWNDYPDDNLKPVLASASGHASLGYQSGGWGYYVLIDHGNGWQTRYAHLQEAGRVSGPVTQGQRIGAVGSTGLSGDPHLHWEQIADGIRQTTLYANGAAVISGTSYGPSDPVHTSRNCPGAGSIRATLDSASSPEAGTIRVRGWAFDPDRRTSPVSIHVYVGARPGAAGAEGHNLGAADGSRPDVGRAFPGVGDNHGFSESFTTARTGVQPVYVYAINIAGTPGGNVLVGSRTITIANPSPRGTLDSATSTTSDTVRVAGWAFDPNELSSPVSIHVYVGGKPGAPGAEGHNLGAAGGHRPDVGRAYAGVGDYHGFANSFTTAKTGSQPVYVYAINIAGTPGRNVLIGSRTVTIRP